MSGQAVVCPFDRELIADFHGQDLVPVTSDPSIVPAIVDHVSGTDNRLRAIWLQWDGALSDVPFRGEWERVPVALYARRLGRFSDFMAVRRRLQQLDVRVFLSAHEDSAATELKILASIGVSCGVHFGDEPIDWDRINDLMHYALYSRTSHAPVEPFRYAATTYDPARFADLARVYFDSPDAYLHVDRDRNVALTASDLARGRFVGHGIDALEAIQANGVAKEHARRWQIHMLRRDRCSFCIAFRLCVGLFAYQRDRGDGCERFFADLMDAVEHARAIEHGTGRGVWPL
jgi:hypothetical protein